MTPRSAPLRDAMAAVGLASCSLPAPSSSGHPPDGSLRQGVQLGENDDAGAEHAAHGGGGGGGDGGSSNDSANGLCRWMPHWELWGHPVKLGPSNLQDSAAACCQSCRDMCQGGGKCHCNPWVYCGDKERCGEQHRQCWLKWPEDALRPEVHNDAGVPWISGMLYTGTGVSFGCQSPKLSLALVVTAGHHHTRPPEGDIRVKLRPEWAPATVSYLRDLLQLRHCTGCRFYRAEDLGAAWAADGIPVNGVLRQDMASVEKIVEKKTKVETWGQVDVHVLEAPVSFTVSRTEAKSLKEDF
eukprot:SM000021S06461  [mRNA]  locus=s21:404190:405905:- [translate_table: standard]